MALLAGHRFDVLTAAVFPDGVYALKVEQAEDYDEKTGRRTPAKDKLTGELVWTVTCMDRDPATRKAEVKVKVTAPYLPVLPPEILPGAGIAAVEFSGLTVTPYVEETGRRARLAFSYRATGVHAQGKTPSGSTSATGSGSSTTGGKPAVSAAGDGKAA
jgi:hypothetical protein